MAHRSRHAAHLILTACGLALVGAATVRAQSADEPAHSAALDEMIIKSAARHGVPEKLVRRVVMRESKYNPHARNHSFWGLMQISYPTAKSMGFHGSPRELLNPVVNLRYAVPYLANAFIIAGKREDAAIRLYASGYYDTAKRRGLLSALRTADSTPLSGVPDDPTLVAAAPPPAPEENTGIFGALFGPQQMPREAQPEQVATAAVPAPEQAGTTSPPPQAVASLPNGKIGDEVALVADKAGELHPPKKWQRDGGTTVIARGEQAIEHDAAYEKATGEDSPTKPSRHHSHKTTVFATLDLQPASAQAYAATAGGQDPRLMQAESQAAITQATSAQAVQAASVQPGSSQAAAQPVANSPAAQPTVASDEHVKKGHRRHVAHRDRHHQDADTNTAQAPQSQEPAAAAGQPPTAAAQEPSPVPAAQTAEAASTQAGYPPDVGGDPQQPASADEAEAPKHKHHSRHARAHKTTTDVAAQPTPETSATQ